MHFTGCFDLANFPFPKSFEFFNTLEIIPSSLFLFNNSDLCSLVSPKQAICILIVSKNLRPLLFSIIVLNIEKMNSK